MHPMTDPKLTLKSYEFFKKSKKSIFFLNLRYNYRLFIGSLTA